jgi:hypothetical protein
MDLQRKSIKEIYPITIIKDRYSGFYSGGEFVAFNLELNEVPSEVLSNNEDCFYFWDNCNILVGVGETPNEALNDLINKI